MHRDLVRRPDRPSHDGVLGVVQRRAGEPLRARHLRAAQHRARTGCRECTSKYSQIADQNPSRSVTDQRCSSR